MDVPAFLAPWFVGHGIFLAVIIGRRVLRDVAGF